MLPKDVFIVLGKNIVLHNKLKLNIIINSLINNK